MLKSTFIHLPGIGARTEKVLWERGIQTWEDYERTFFPQRSMFRESKRASIASTLASSREALANGDFTYFAEALPKREHYRIALTVPERTAFLDIETTGLSLYYDQVTVVGVSIGAEYYCYVRGSSTKRLRDILHRAACLVTFNGTLFDLKFLRKEFPDVPLPSAHVDLRFLCQSVGLTGGQKKIEQEIGAKVRESVLEVNGAVAPVLWYRYRMGSLDAGKTLIQYNYADVVGMKAIIDVALDRKRERDLARILPASNKHFYRPAKNLSWATTRKTESRGYIYLPRYRGRTGPHVTYREMVAALGKRDPKLVGIDLTGSEERASGWCDLSRDFAVTRRIFRDTDLVTQTTQVKPDVVSIDSPLSLPQGRTSVGDDDPGRAKFGIMRSCERALKKRGVNVYPSLIPSMQAMTARGIRLAEQFRSLGIPVIESYPGAAQDIIGIPRKGAGIENLRKALVDFGIRGQICDTTISHDELDAVTSALVGLFFWSGLFEALGNENEDYLIIPNLSAASENWLNRVVVGLSGETISENPRFTRLLKDRAYLYTNLETPRLVAPQKDAPPRSVRGVSPPATLNTLGRGSRRSCQQLFRSLPRKGNVFIDGLCSAEAHAYFVEAYGPAFVHVHVAPENSCQDAPTRTSDMPFRCENGPSRAGEEDVGIVEQQAHIKIHNDKMSFQLLARILDEVAARANLSGG